jgi:RNA polymerase sigma-70 factor (ECF subfamily)
MCLQFDEAQYETTPNTVGDFKQYMEVMYPRIHSFALRLTGNQSDADDLTQETFYRAYRGFDQYAGIMPFESWIYKILTRLFYDSLRSKARRINAFSIESNLIMTRDDHSSIEISDSKNDPEKVLLQQTISEGLEHSLKALRPSQRLLVYLSDIQQLSYTEISEVVGLPVNTIRSRLHRAHKQMRDELHKFNSERGE